MKSQRGIACATLPQRVLHGVAGRLAAAVLFVLVAAIARSSEASREPGTNSTALKPHQVVSHGEPPRSPGEFNPDTGAQLLPTNFLTAPKMRLRLERITNQAPTLPPAVFNPDPGASFRTTPVEQPFFTNEFGGLPRYNGEPISPGLALPRTNLFSDELEPTPATNATPYGSEPLDEKLKLPRRDVRRNLSIEYKYGNPDYPLSRRGLGYPTNSVPEPDRWRIGFAPWRRYTSGNTETPYESPVTALWRPYQQSLLKGDAPIIGQDIFLDLTAETETEFEGRRVPTGSGVSSAQPNSAEFFGRSEEIAVNNNLSFSMDLFEGETVFQPVHWAIHVQPVYNVNYLQAGETGIVSPDPRGSGPNTPLPNNGGIINPGDLNGLLNGQITDGPENPGATTRLRNFLALQEAFVELHISDLSENYDFITSRIGNQPFNNDFRGFLFNDINSGARVFGNIDNNRYQYNFTAFDMREKDTDSGLNTFEARRQYIFGANIYRQDFVWTGYTAQLSFLANLDDGRTHFDRNGFLVRPEPIGTLKPHDVNAYYLGWAGDGHIGRLNLSHQFYEAFGHDEFNDLAGRPVNINAQMAALELSYDEDWIRYKGSIFYASGDHNTRSGTATGFDTVLDNPNFTGGPFSYWVRQGLALGGTFVNLKQDNSLVPDIRSSKTEGQANFVNPGVYIFSTGTEMDLTPKLRSFCNLNYIRFVDTNPLKTVLLTDKIDDEVGWDLSLGFQYRPLLTDNIIISAGFGALLPGRGYRDLFRTTTQSVPGFTPASNAGHVDDFLYSGIVAVTFTY